ncbi:MAG TPA: DMT family transporter [Coriobacteriia bacterium]
MAEHGTGDRDDRLRGYALVVLAAACWAAGGLTAKWFFNGTGFEVHPAELSAARAFLAFAMLAAYLVAARRDALRVRPRDLPFLGVFGVLGLAMVHFSYFATIELTNVPTAIVLEYLAPVLVLAVSVAFLGERFTLALPAGVALSVLGCALVVGVVGGQGLKVSPLGITWGLVSAVFFAGYTVMGKFAAKRFSSWTLLTYGLGAASLFWLVFLGGPMPVVRLLSDPVRATGVVVMAFFSTVVPFGAYLKALSYIDATKASITATLEPVIAAAAALAIPAVYEPLSPLQLLGGAVVIAACVVVQAPSSRRRPTVPRLEPELPPAP